MPETVVLTVTVPKVLLEQTVLPVRAVEALGNVFTITPAVSVMGIIAQPGMLDETLTIFKPALKLEIGILRLTVLPLEILATSAPTATAPIKAWYLTSF
jgi:hypothetical protein